MANVKAEDTISLASVKTVNDAAEYAIGRAEDANSAAVRAEGKADIAAGAAERAEGKADEAKSSAATANSAAVGALKSLSVVERVVDTLKWISEHGEYVLTSDVSVDESKTYFTRSSIYITVEEPEVNPQEAGYYELSGDSYVLTSDTSVIAGKVYYEERDAYYPVTEPVITQLSTYYELNLDEALSNFVASHIALLDEGLSVFKSADGYRTVHADDGIKLYDNLDRLIVTYGAGVIFDGEKSFRIGNDQSYLEFYDSDNDNIPDSLVISAAKVRFGDSTEVMEDILSNAMSMSAEVSERLGETEKDVDELEAKAASNESAIVSTRNAVTEADQRLTESIQANGKEIAKYGGYIDIDETNARMILGKKTSDNKLWIDNTAIYFLLKGIITASLNGQIFAAPQAQFARIDMRTTDTNGNTVGKLSWVSRSNGHLSLKVVK